VADAVVIGSGPNGLVAANLLADAGWEVEVLEAEAEAGGAVRTAELTEPGFRHDAFSAFYPLAAASPVMRALELERHGLDWAHAPLALAHPARDGSCAVISRDLAETAASLDSFAPGDGEAWAALYRVWERIGDALMEAVATTPFPPLRAGARIAARLERGERLAFLRSLLLPMRRLAEEQFRGDGGGRLLAGNALHTDLTLDAPLSGFYGWFLSCLAQDVGFPCVRGGAGGLTDALMRRLESRGGRVRCGARVIRVLVRGGRAAGVELDGGEEVVAGRAVLADVSAPDLYLRLLPRERVPARILSHISRFQWDHATVKLDWALDGPIPWAAPDASRAAVVHVADSLDELGAHAELLAGHRVPALPFLVLGQYSEADPGRTPAGKEVAWAYAHVPQEVGGDAGGDGLSGRWGARETEVFAARMEERVEALAPGFRRLIRSRHVHTPRTLEAANRNLAGGAIGGGTAQLHQQLIFRPIPGLGRSETSVAGLYLASASAHPGGGVHGAPGAIAARAALAAGRARKAALALAGVAGAAALLARARVR
jgi:phytoene dehydrogenase-like protein